jgi:hypothetical protein
VVVVVFVGGLYAVVVVVVVVVQFMLSGVEVFVKKSLCHVGKHGCIVRFSNTKLGSVNGFISVPI